MLWGAIASFILALAMAVLVGLGLAHAARTEPSAQMLTNTKVSTGVMSPVN